MKRSASIIRTPARRGLLMTEMLVAAMLLITTLSLVVTLAFRTGKLWQDSRHYQLAVAELANQLDRLTTLEARELDEQLIDLEPSTEILTALPNPRLSGQTLVDEHGTRLQLQIVWDRPGSAAPVSLVAWLTPPHGGSAP